MLICTIVGNIGNDVRQVSKNTARPFYTFPVAHSEKFTNSQGVKVERTTWVDVVLNFNAERLLQYLVRGAKVAVTGNLTLKPYINGKGEAFVDATINASTLELCGSPTPTPTASAQGASSPFAPEQPPQEGSAPAKKVQEATFLPNPHPDAPF